jgi:hypothetical protein
LRQRIVGFNTHVLLFARTPEAWAVGTALTRIHAEPEVVATAPSCARRRWPRTIDSGPSSQLRGVVRASTWRASG